MPNQIGFRSRLRTLIDLGQLDEARRIISRLSVPLLLEELRYMNPRRGLFACGLVDPRRLPEVLKNMDRHDRQRILGSAQASELKDLFLALPEDLLPDLLDELPARLSQHMMNLLPSTLQKKLRSQLTWKPGSVGAIMTKGWISLTPKDTVEDALEKIRRESSRSERVHYCFAQSEDGTFLGTISLEDLVLSDPEMSVESLIEPDCHAVDPETRQHDAGLQMGRYDVQVLPVVKDHRLIGLLTYDDVFDIMEQDNTDQILHFAGISGKEGFEEETIWRQICRRFPCLLLCLITGVMTTGLMQRFEGILGTVLVLTFFIPLLSDTAGNTGSQSSVLIIRAMGLGQLEDDKKSLRFVLVREMITGLLLGLAMAVMVAARAWMLDVGLGVALVVSLAMVLVVFTANLLGALLPFISQKFGFDPAVISGPLLTTITDVLGLTIYLSVAETFLLKK